MRKVYPFELKDGMKVSELLKQYSNMEVLAAGELSRAVEVYTEMISKKAVVFLGLAGPLVPGGLREVITDLIRSGLVNVVVSTGANIVHDMIEAFGGCHYAGSFDGDDGELRKRGIGRAGNIYVPMEDFLIFERRCREIFGGIPKKKRQDLSVKELLSVIGATIEDKGSFLKAAYDNGVPVFAPGVSDSMLGLQLFFYSQEKKIVLDVLKDMKDLADIVFKAEKTGALIIGGGVPKHYILGANTLRGGVEYAVQITTDRGDGGSLSGARLEEAISWGKANSKAKLVTLVGDATILFPLVALGVKERVRK